MNDALAAVDLETIFAGRGFAGIAASPLQRAITRAAAGRVASDVLTREQWLEYFGTEKLPGVPPIIVVLICGVRGGKSFLAACAAIHGCMHADCSKLKKHEVPRFAIIGPFVDTAEATFRILLGILRGSPILHTLIEGEPTSDSVTLRRPDGYLVEICVVAASRGGVTVRNRWLCGFVIEEVAQVGQEQTGAAVSAEEILRAAETRLLPRAQGWLISSPFGPTGLLWKLYQKYFGKPCRRALVVHAPTRAMNPSFPQSKIDAIDDPDVVAREYLAQWVDAESSFLESVLVDAATRPGPMVRPPPGERVQCFAGMDTATRGNSWTLAIGWPSAGKLIVGGVWQWTGSKKAPLSPDSVFSQIAPIVLAYGIGVIPVDRWSFDPMNDIAIKHGVSLIEHTGEAASRYQALKTYLANGEIEIPPDPVLRSDLLGIRRRALAGSIRIELPRTADGRHCDYAPSVALLAAQMKELGGSPALRPTLTQLRRLAAGSRWGGARGRGF